MAPPPLTPLREHRLRDIKSSTGSPPPPPLRDASEQNQHLHLPFRLLAESVALAMASASALSLAAGDARTRALTAAGDLAARSLVLPLRSTATQGCAAAFGAAGATSAVLESSRRLASSACESVGDNLLPLSFVYNQVAAAVRLAGALLTYLGWGGLWLLQAVRLVAYALLLLPGFARVSERKRGSNFRCQVFCCFFLLPSSSLLRLPRPDDLLLSSIINKKKQVGLFYFTSERVARGVRYGPRPRNTADLYVPPGCGFGAAELAAAATVAVSWATALAASASNATSPKESRRKSVGPGPALEVPALFSASPPRPVVVYVTGGAWLIGHRAWGSLLAARLSAAAGAVVLCLDYRNFPQAGAGGAAEDVGAGIGWAVSAFDVLSGVKREQGGGGGGGGGKRGKERSGKANSGGGGGGVVVVGQSAGAHLSALAILSRCAASEGTALPCVSAEAASRMMSAAAAANANAPSPKSSPGPGSGSASPSGSASIEVDATENVVVLSAPPSSSSSRPGSSSSPAPSSPEEARASPSALQRLPSVTLPSPLHPLPSLADAAATLGACDPRASGGRFPPPLDPPEWCCLGTSSSKGDVAAFVGVSGVYDVASLAPHLAKRGLRPRLLERIMSLPVPSAAAAAAHGGGGGEANGAAAAAAAGNAFWKPALAELSPTVLLLDCLRKQREDADASAYLSASPSPLSYWPSRMPRTALLHGTADACAPASDAARFVEAARAAGAREVSLRLYDGETHTSPLIENPMRGWGRDALGADLSALVVAAAAAARGGSGNEPNGNGGGRQRNAHAAAPPAHAATTTSVTLLRTSSSAPLAPSKQQQQRLGAVDGGGALCPAPLIAAAAVVCPF